MEKQKMEINQLKLELSNRQQDARKSKSRYASYTHIYDRNEREHESATSMKTERTTSQRIQKLEEENQTLKYQVENTRRALQEKEVSCVCVGGGGYMCMHLCICVYPHMYVCMHIRTCVCAK